MVLFKPIVFLCVIAAAKGSSWYSELVQNGQRTLVQCRRKTSSFESLDEDLSTSVGKMKDCVKYEFLDSLDKIVSSSEISLSDSVSLVNLNNAIDESTNRSDPQDDLLTTVTSKMYSILDTHSIQINLGALLGNESEGQVEGRRRRYRRAFPIMVIGFIILSSFLVPLGFQFMSMVGGLALLLAKMAFAMSMYSGYQRINADLNYHHHPDHLLHHQLHFHRSFDTSVRPNKKIRRTPKPSS